MAKMVDQLCMLPPLGDNENIEELNEQIKAAQEYAKAKRNWENAFQKWSNDISQDGSNPYGCCGCGTICDYCSDNDKGRPCVRAINEKARVNKIKIDYADRNFERWFYI